MLEGSVMEIIKWVTFIALILMALALFLFFYQVGQTNRFESYVVTQVERHAGLTDEAVANIKQENETFYNGRYVVTVDDESVPDDITVTTDEDGYSVMSEPMDFGQAVAFDVEGSYPILFGFIDPVYITTADEAVVQVRGGA